MTLVAKSRATLLASIASRQRIRTALHCVLHTAINNCNIDVELVLRPDSISYTLLDAGCFRLLYASIARPTLATDDIRAKEPPLPIPRH